MALFLSLLKEATAELGFLSHFTTGFLCDPGQFILAWILQEFDDITFFRVCMNEMHIADPECLVLPMSTNYY